MNHAANPTFSVLMPAFKTECWIDEAIRSVLAQTRGDWELIIVEDGSPDALAERVEPFLAEPRVRFIRQANRGIGAARNAVAAVARGRYLALLDSDDALLPRLHGDDQRAARRPTAGRAGLL